MATYAAYRHIELDKVGAGKKRVLKPPGGGTSELFGGSESEKPVVRKNDAASTNGNSISAVFENGHGTQGTCNERLFGPASILASAVNKLSNGHGGDEPDAVVKKSSASSTTAAAAAAADAAAANRGRVPPGGYSSGLW